MNKQVVLDLNAIKDKMVDDIKKEIDDYLLNVIKRGNRLKCGLIEDEIHDSELREQIDEVIRAFGGKNIIMKPLIYFDEFETHGDNVEIKKEALSKIFDEVYQAGYEDGKRDNSLTYPYVLRGEIDRMPTVTTANLNMNK